MDPFDASEAFEAAAARVASLAGAGDLSDDQLLKLYALFKQGTDGPCTSAKPSFFDLKGKAKWGAWSALGALPPAEARRQYVELLSAAQPGWDAGGPPPKASGVGGPVFSSLALADDPPEGQEKCTPLIAAAISGDASAVRALLEGGALVDQRDAEGCSALHWAADKGAAAAAEALISAGADIDATDGDGLTPLHYAALAEQREVAALLLQRGADAKKCTSAAETARSLAPASWAGEFDVFEG